MRYNGTIAFEVITPAGENEYGEPTPSQTEWTEPIKCSIKANSDTRKGKYDTRKGKYEDGNFRQASYVVLIETRDISDNLHRVQLTRQSENLGEHAILNIEPLPSVGRIQILV